MIPGNRQAWRSPSRLFLGVAVVIALLVGYWLVRSGTGSRNVEVAPGTEIFAIDTSLIVEMSYENPDVSVTAKRADPKGKQFQIHFESKVAQAKQDCLSGPGFDKVLKAFSSLKARRSHNSVETKSILASHPVDLGVVVLRDSTNIGPVRWLFRGSDDTSKIIASDGFQTYEIDLKREPFDLLKDGCTSLSDRTP
jgi:hypothetical protein